MEKSIRTMAIIAGILYTLSTFFASVLMPFFLIISYRYDWEGIALGVALSIFKGLSSITIMIVFMILMIHASNSMSESIGVEVTGLVFYGGLSTLMALIFNFVLVFVNRYWGTSAIASFAAVNNAQSVVAPIVTASTILMVASFVTSICRKKVVIPLLYDKGYIDSDEDSQV